MQVKLYYHKTDGGAEYLTDSVFENAQFVVRIDGDIHRDAELSIAAEMHAAPDLLEACEEAQEVMDAAANQISEDRYIDADELKATANQLADYAMKLRDAILLADPPEFVEE